MLAYTHPRAINAEQASTLGHPNIRRVTRLLNLLAMWPPTCGVDAPLRPLLTSF